MEGEQMLWMEDEQILWDQLAEAIRERHWCIAQMPTLRFDGWLSPEEQEHNKHMAEYWLYRQQVLRRALGISSMCV